MQASLLGHIDKDHRLVRRRSLFTASEQQQARAAQCAVQISLSGHYG